jgi:hypothetical protein
MISWPWLGMVPPVLRKRRCRVSGVLRWLGGFERDPDHPLLRERPTGDGVTVARAALQRM